MIYCRGKNPQVQAAVKAATHLGSMAQQIRLVLEVFVGNRNVLWIPWQAPNEEAQKTLRILEQLHFETQVSVVETECLNACQEVTMLLELPS